MPLYPEVLNPIGYIKIYHILLKKILKLKSNHIFNEQTVFLSHVQLHHCFNSE